jgi:hypothetical protein
MRLAVAAPRRTGSFEVSGLPQLIVDDAVHVRVVLAEIAGRIFEVPEEV